MDGKVPEHFFETVLFRLRTHYRSGLCPSKGPWKNGHPEIIIKCGKVKRQLNRALHLDLHGPAKEFYGGVVIPDYMSVK